MGLNGIEITGDYMVQTLQEMKEAADYKRRSNDDLPKMPKS